MTNEIAKTGGGALAQYTPETHNILAPIVAQADIPQGARMSIRVVKINPDPAKGDVWKVPGGKVALTKTAIERIALTAGISMDVNRTDGRMIPHVYGFKATVRIVDPDGLSREANGTKETDFREGGKDVEGMGKAAREQAQKFGAENTSTKAMLRALRSCLAIPASFDPKEVGKPFVIPKLILDTENDAEAKSIALASMANAQNQLYPPADRGSVGEDIVQEAQEVDEEPGEKTVGQEAFDPQAKERLQACWDNARKVKMKGEEFKRISHDVTGDKPIEEVTVAEVDEVISRVVLRIGELSLGDSTEVPY